MKQPDVSVIVPVYGNKERLDNCISSICCQTLDNIEIILVDDGNATVDGDIPKILDAYSKMDSRVEVIHQDNHGAGYAINRGIEKAIGKYIAEVDCDDSIDKNMYKDLLEIADDCDVVKSGFNMVQDGQKIKYDLFPKGYNNLEFVPRNAMLPIQKDIFCACPSMWSALYRKDFLLKNNIWMRETAGAGFQDTAFTFKTKLFANRYKITTNAYYNYTIDNPNSSIHSHNALFSLANEYDEVERVMKQHHFNNWDIFARVKMSGYIWFWNRLDDPEEREQFWLRLCDEFNHEIYNPSLYSEDELSLLQKILR